MMPNKENLWCPDLCPITGRPFFMWLEHPTKGYVPTYGGPFDSYTLAEPDADEGTFFCERYDHDAGSWCDWSDGINMRLIDDQREDHEYGTVEALRACIAELEARQVPGFFLPASALNEPMLAGLLQLIDAAKRARWTNAVTRKDGKETVYEADWIKHLVSVDGTKAAAPSPADSGEVKP